MGDRPVEEAMWAGLFFSRADTHPMKPNIILINADDLGYGDLGCYGSTTHRTPHLDKMAEEGVRLTDFYMASPVCSPSRGAMMTGCYPNRISFDEFDGLPVLFPGSAYGLHPDEYTIARQLKKQGYANAMVGKWHCGDQQPFLPTSHGFDSYFGLPYSNDMGRQAHPGERPWVQRIASALDVDYGNEQDPTTWSMPPLPLMRDETVIQEQPDQAALTERYVGESIRFIREHQEGPFFLYLAHMYVHLPVYTPEPYLKNSRNGRYGAGVEHLDWSVGVIMAELKRLGIDEQTMVLFTSDNGSRAKDNGNNSGAGSNAPLRGSKGSCWEGGQRVPMIARWPGIIPAGSTCAGVASAIDLLPTFVKLAGGDPYEDPERPIDGKDIFPILQDSTRQSPRDVFTYYHTGTLHAVRVGKWKLHVARNVKREQMRITPELYDLSNDPGETTDLAREHPETVAAIEKIAETTRASLGDRLSGIAGTERRPKGRVETHRPLTTYDPDHPYFAAEYDLSDGG